MRRIFDSARPFIKSVVRKIWLISYNRNGSFRVSRIIKCIREYGITLELDLAELIDRSYALGIYNRKSINFLLQHMNSECTWFVDAGANLGFYSFAIASKLGSAHCLAIEPDPYSQSKFEANISLNSGGINQPPQIFLEKCALGSHEGFIDLMINDAGNRGGSSICLDQKEFTGKDTNKTISVRMNRLSSLLCKYNILGANWCLKLDIEGFEYPAIESLLSDLPYNHLPRAIVVEWTGSGVLGDNDETPVDLLCRSGYHLCGKEGTENYLFARY